MRSRSHRHEKPRSSPACNRTPRRAGEAGTTPARENVHTLFAGVKGNSVCSACDTVDSQITKCRKSPRTRSGKNLRWGLRMVVKEQ
eukprot:14244138-Alexandrium_andersonii.AAC.1